MYQLTLYGQTILDLATAKAVLASEVQHDVILTWLTETNQENFDALWYINYEPDTPLARQADGGALVDLGGVLIQVLTTKNLIFIGPWSISKRTPPALYHVTELVRTGLERLFATSDQGIWVYGDVSDAGYREYLPVQKLTDPPATHPKFPHLARLGVLDLQSGDIR